MHQQHGTVGRTRKRSVLRRFRQTCISIFERPLFFPIALQTAPVHPPSPAEMIGPSSRLHDIVPDITGMGQWND